MRLANFHQFNESLKDDKLNDILGKISNGETLTQFDKKFLDNFDSIKDVDFRDYTHLSTSDIYDKVSELLSRNKVIIFNGKKILEIKYIKDDICIIIDSNIIKLKDNFTYSIIYNDTEDTHTIIEQDEFFEKQPLRND